MLLAGAEDQAVAAGKADRGHAQCAQARDQPLVHLPGQNHQRHVAGFRVGHAQAVDEFALLSERLQHLRQLRAAAMNHGHLMAVAHQFRNGAH